MGNHYSINSKCKITITINKIPTSTKTKFTTSMNSSQVRPTTVTSGKSSAVATTWAICCSACMVKKKSLRSVIQLWKPKRNPQWPKSKNSERRIKDHAPKRLWLIILTSQESNISTTLLILSQKRDTKMISCTNWIKKGESLWSPTVSEESTEMLWLRSYKKFTDLVTSE